jgi:hypothetical protein
MNTKINLNNIPTYFKESELYKNSVLSNTFEIDINIQYTKFDKLINNIEDLCHFLDTIQYWKFSKKNYPIEIFDILDNYRITELFSYHIKHKYVELNIIEEISFLNKKRPNRSYKPKIQLKKTLLYLEGNNLIEEAAENGYFGLVKYAQKIGYLITDVVALRAAEKGHVNILQYVFDNITSMLYTEHHTFSSKIVHNDLQPKCYFNLIGKYAAKNGHLDCLKLAHNFGIKLDKHIPINAAIRGHLDCLKYAYENGAPLTKEVCYYSAIGHLQCLEYAHKNGCIWDSKLYEHAIIGGDLDSIKYAYENGCTWNDKICEDAALLNFLDILKYAIEHDAPKNSNVCNRAASKGNYECLKYAYEHGCDFDENICYEANCGKNLECIIYVHEKGCLCSRDKECIVYLLEGNNLIT